MALMVLAASVTSVAQSVVDDDYQLSVNVELVQLPVSVLDKKGFPVRGLRKEDFVVYEDKIEQEISLFKQEDVPLSVALVVDTSGSMVDKLNSLNTAATTFIRESNAEDETALVSFGDDAFLEMDFTRRTDQLSAALSHIAPSGNTSLYDAVFLAARHLKEDGSHEKKVLLIISDGEDNHSKYKLEEVLESMRESKIIVYSVGLLGTDPGILNRVYFGGTGKKALRQLAEITGGAAFFPKGIENVESVCKRIARDLRNQYTIGYKPSNERLDGSWRKTLVQVNLPKNTPKVQVRIKQGYYAPSTREARGPSQPVLK